MEWTPLKLSHKPLFDDHLKTYPIALSDYTFTNFWIWNAARHYQIAQFEKWLCVKFIFKDQTLLMMPIGPEPTSALIHALWESTPDFKMRAISEESLPKITGLLPQSFTVIAEENRFDYLYRFDQLKSLTGNDLQPKRNLVHQFEEEYGITYEPLSQDNIPW
jgi:hypothetical protein